MEQNGFKTELNNMIKEVLEKLFGSSYTAITGAWNFHRETVEASSAISIALTMMLSCISNTSKHFLGISGTLLAMILVIITADFITGITYAFREQKRKRRQIVCAAKGIRSAYKLGVYIVFLFCTNALVREYEGMWVSDIVKYIHIYITLHVFFWESFSVDENMEKLGMNLGLRKFLQSTLAGIQKRVSNEVDNSKPTDHE